MCNGEQSQIKLVSDFHVKEKSGKQKLLKQWKTQIVYDEYVELWPSHSERSFFGCFYRFAKRLIDIIGAFVGLIFFVPLMVIIVCLIKLDSSGHVFLRQIRIGKNRRVHLNGKRLSSDRRNGDLKGKPILIYKFRSMKTGVESYATSPSDCSDPRITRVGKVIRRLCLDELPQLVNVLKGDMSLVGPRPEMPFIVKTYGPLEALRLTVKPGITGLWQLNAPRTQPIHENLKYDLEYIRQRSLALDFKIMFKTVSFILNSKNV